jgi:hypothetical protein
MTLMIPLILVWLRHLEVFLLHFSDSNKLFLPESNNEGWPTSTATHSRPTTSLFASNHPLAQRTMTMMM